MPPRRPNILVLMCDQLRADAFGALGSPVAHTPNLDGLLARGVRFTNCFTQSPVCAPTRHSLATGLYPHAHGVIDNSRKPTSPLRTIAHALRPMGYRCLQAGHMHWTDPTIDTGYRPNPSTPALWRQTVPPEVLERRAWECQEITRRTTAGPSPFGPERFWGHHVATESVRMIESAVAAGEPFLCWASFSEPHPPFYPPREFYERIDQSRIAIPPPPPPGAPPPHEEILRRRKEWAHLTDVERRQIVAGYYGMVALADHYCGMLLEALGRLGVRERTIVLLTADHGDQVFEHGLMLKFVMREASVRVPLVIDAPGGGRGERGELTEHVDVLPTLCELVGAEAPPGVQGRSLAGLLAGGPTPPGWRDAVFSRFGNVRMIRTSRWKLNTYDGKPGELFDLRADPDELFNRIADPACAPAAEGLLARLEKWG